MKTILFLCTGNHYRSRFAEILFNVQAAERGLPWKAESRGLALDLRNPGPMSRFTVAWMETRGIALEAYQRYPLDTTRQDFEAADRVVAVKETEHLPLIRRRFPAFLDRVEFWEVHDIDCAGPEVALPHLERAVMALLERLDPPKSQEMERTPLGRA